MIIHDGAVKLSQRQIEKYTAELWPTWECPAPKRAAIVNEQIQAMQMAAQMAQGSFEQLEAVTRALRELMNNE
jgi:hypothetical protein